MSQPELEPLAPDLLRLLATEKSRPAPPPAMQARVLERIGHELLADIPLVGAPRAGVPSFHPASSALSRLHRLPVTVGLVALGGLGGAGVHALIQKKQQLVPAPIVAPAAPLPPAAPPVPSEAAPAIVAPAPVKTAPPAPRAPVHHQAPTLPPAPAGVEDEHRMARDGELAAERALLEQARTALARGNPADALALLSRHARAFEKGRLAEERQALTILALAADHQLDAARSDAVKFRREFPNSMLLRAVDAALETPR